MFGLFSRPRHDPEQLRRIKAWVAGRFDLGDDVALTIAELRCHEPGCPPVETVIACLGPGRSRREWRIAKPVAQVTVEDVQGLEEAGVDGA